MPIISVGTPGNYEYACARVKSRKAFLLKRDAYLKMLAMRDATQIIRFLSEGTYKKEIDELSKKYEGYQLIEISAYRAMARDCKSILSFTTGEAHDMMAMYLKRWDIWNLKNIIRGIRYNAREEEIMEEMVPAGKLDDGEIRKLVKIRSLKEIAESIPIRDYCEEIEMSSRCSDTEYPEIEAELYKKYYTNLQNYLMNVKSKDRGAFLNFIKMEVDAENLKVLSRLKVTNTDPTTIKKFIIPGGKEIVEEKLARLLSAENISEFTNEMNTISFYQNIKDGIEELKAKKSVHKLSLDLTRHLIKFSEKFAYLNPISVLPMINYLVLKWNEVLNIKIIARGKQINLPSDTIMEMLVM